MATTTKAKHTPGPWQAIGSGNGESYDIHRKTETIDGGFFCRIEAMHRTEEARAIALANARLIEQSPQLLECLDGVTAALESVMAHFGDKMPKGDQDSRNALIDRARHLAAKATA